MSYVAKLRFSQLFRTENLYLFLCSFCGLYVTKSKVFLFLLLSYTVFFLIITITNSSILISAFAA